MIAFYNLYQTNAMMVMSVDCSFLFWGRDVFWIFDVAISYFFAFL